MHETAKTNEHVRWLVQRLGSFIVAAILRTSACNRLHTLSQRCCTALLTIFDDVNGETFVLTHEFFALTLATNRPNLTMAVNALRAEKIIDYPQRPNS